MYFTSTPQKLLTHEQSLSYKTLMSIDLIFYYILKRSQVFVVEQPTKGWAQILTARILLLIKTKY
jgi:hypothetical protein